MNFNRRTMLGGAVALTAGLITAPSALAAATRTRLTLPTPTGSHRIGTVSMRLVDPSRKDPWLSTPRPRELMISLWYPAQLSITGRLAPWMPAGALRYFRAEQARSLELVAQQIGLGTVDISLDGVDYPTTHARLGAPAARGRYPVVLFSPGDLADREEGTVLVEDLASRGYVVVTLGHTYDSAETEFPSGRVKLAGDPRLQPDIKVALHRADARFVLDQLTKLNEGGAADPAGLRGSLDLDRVGMFGHSFGGATTANTMLVDARVKAGIDLDGTVVPDVPLPSPPPPGGSQEEIDRVLKQSADLVATVARGIGDRPFMIMSSGGKGPADLGVLMTGFWDNLSGWRRFLSLTGSHHSSYTDNDTLVAQLAAAGVIPPEVGRQSVGLDPARAVPAERAYIGAFFDLWLRGHDNYLLDGPSDRYPDIKFF